MENIKTNLHGFTMIDLMTAISIIALISTMGAAAVKRAQEKGRDARRLADLGQIERALALYYNDNGRYPAVELAYTGDTTCGSNWCILETALAPYLTHLPRDPKGLQIAFVYFYDADAADNYQTYGLMMVVESAGNFHLTGEDAGYFQGLDPYYYEVGSQPQYCMSRGGRSWWESEASVCSGGVN